MQAIGNLVQQGMTLAQNTTKTVANTGAHLFDRANVGGYLSALQESQYATLIGWVATQAAMRATVHTSFREWKSKGRTYCGTFTDFRTRDYIKAFVLVAAMKTILNTGADLSRLNGDVAMGILGSTALAILDNRAIERVWDARPNDSTQGKILTSAAGLFLAGRTLYMLPPSTPILGRISSWMGSKIA